MRSGSWFQTRAAHSGSRDLVAPTVRSLSHSTITGPCGDIRITGAVVRASRATARCPPDLAHSPMRPLPPATRHGLSHPASRIRRPPMWIHRSEPTIPSEPFYQRQLHRRGCGVAVLAMVLEESYTEVLSSIDPPVDFDRKGMQVDFFFDYLFDRGYAMLARTRPPQPVPGAWPPKPWTQKHVLIVKKRWWHQLHLALLLEDGRVLDPHYGEVDMSFYWRVRAVAGLYRVESW